MNYVEHHFGDYAKDTAHLSVLEHGAYRMLLDLYYVREKPLPLETRECCRLIRAGSSVERKAVETVLTEFFQKDADGWRHKRCDREIARFHEKQEKARRSATARWAAKPTHSERNANALRTQSEGNAPNHQTPDTSQKIKDKDAADAADVWGFGVDLLTREAGLGSGTARSYIGALCRTWPEATVLDALMAAAGKADPKAYARKWLEEKPRKGQRTLSAAEQLMAEMGVGSASQ